jgi:hypothetical protein
VGRTRRGAQEPIGSVMRFDGATERAKGGNSRCIALLAQRAFRIPPRVLFKKKEGAVRVAALKGRVSPGEETHFGGDIARRQ